MVGDLWRRIRSPLLGQFLVGLLAFCPSAGPVTAKPAGGALAALAVSDFAGAYEITYSSITWQFEVDLDGSIRGWVSDVAAKIPISGQVDEDGHFGAVAGSVTERVSLEGTISRDGDVEGRWRSYEGDRERESDTFRGRRIVVTRRFQIAVRAFVPANFVRPSYTPKRCDGQVVHSGDDRMSASGQARFKPNSTKYRMQQTVDIVAEQSGTIVDFSVDKSKKAKRTKEYAFDALSNLIINKSDNDATRNDCHLLNRSKNTSKKYMRIKTKKLSTKQIRIRARGTLPNPLVRLAPAIDWNFIVKVTVENDRMEWVFSGKHDGFPAFEAYIDDQPMYQFDPGAPECELRVEGVTLADYCPGQLAKLGGKKEVVAGQQRGTIRYDAEDDDGEDEAVDCPYWDEESPREQELWRILGWDEKSWCGYKEPPASEYKYWADLSDEERAAASELGYDQALWDST